MGDLSEQGDRNVSSLSRKFVWSWCMVGALSEVPIGRVEEELVGLAGQLSAGLCRWLLVLGGASICWLGYVQLGDACSQALIVA